MRRTPIQNPVVSNNRQVTLAEVILYAAALDRAARDSRGTITFEYPSTEDFAVLGRVLDQVNGHIELLDGEESYQDMSSAMESLIKRLLSGKRKIWAALEKVALADTADPVLDTAARLLRFKI